MRLLRAFIAAVGLAEAVIVAPGSPCSTSCGNVLRSTSTDDLICSQEDYSKKGNDVFQTCIECELYSDYSGVSESGKSETDAQWMLYNLRYAASYCLFGLPTNEKGVISPVCATSEACGPFQDAVQFNDLSSEIESYDYCALWPVTDVKHVNNCRKCLQAGDQDYMANFFTILQAGCEQQPATGVTVAIEGNPFSFEQVNITEPTPRAPIDPEWFDDGPLNLGAKVGIAAGGIVLIFAILGFCVVWRGKRRRRAFLQSYNSSKQGRQGWPSPIQTSNMKETSNTPLSQRPLRSWDDSPMSAGLDQQFPRYFSPYSSQFNSPISTHEVKQFQWPVLGAEQQMPQHQQMQHHQTPQQEAGRSIGLALGGKTPDFASSFKGKQQEEYEMQRVDSSNSVSNEGKHSPTEDNHAQQQSNYTPGHVRSYSGSYRNFRPASRGGPSA